MPDTQVHWRLDRPAEGFYSAELAEPAQPIRTFLPEGYEPRYPYPLIVLFHRSGSNEEQVLKLAPRMSRRNFVAVSLRGQERMPEGTGDQPAYGWGQGPDAVERVTDYLLRAVEQTRRSYHIHTERVYLVGIGDGADIAYRTAFALGDRIAGVAALNGSVPRATHGEPVFRLDKVRGMKVFMAHGLGNEDVPFDTAARDRRLFYAAGADVRLNAYATAHKLHAEMFKDLNKWVIGHVNAGVNVFARK